jgi:hypothetical protein
MKLNKTFLLSWLVVAVLAAPAVLWADTNNSPPDPATIRETEDHLSTLEQQAAKVSRDAERLWSISRNHQTSWESHTYYLNTLREDVNEMGKLLAELEEMKPRTEEVHHMAIEQARPHLVALADDTSKAIGLVRAGSHSLRQPEYKETVAGLSQHADGLYRTVDTIVDYHNADDRLQRLEAPHGGSGI